MLKPWFPGNAGCNDGAAIHRIHDAQGPAVGSRVYCEIHCDTLSFGHMLHTFLVYQLTQPVSLQNEYQLQSSLILNAVARPRGGLNPPTVLRGHSRDLHRTDEKILGVPPPPRNVVHANTLVLVAHLVTFSESQWDQFHPRAKKPTAPWGSPWPPSAALPLDPAGDSAAHSLPCSLPLVSHLLQNSARTNSQNDHLIIIFVTNHYICNKCNNEVNSYICTKLALL